MHRRYLHNEALRTSVLLLGPESTRPFLHATRPLLHVGTNSGAILDLLRPQLISPHWLGLVDRFGVRDQALRSVGSTFLGDHVAFQGRPARNSRTSADL